MYRIVKINEINKNNCIKKTKIRFFKTVIKTKHDTEKFTAMT